MRIDTRIIMTRRLLKEGLLQCMAEKSLSKITVSDLCKQSGINRTTFYNHYESPSMVLRDIAWDYAEQLKTIYETTREETQSGEDAVEACLAFLLSQKKEVKIMLSDHAENMISGFGLEIINRRLSKEREHFKEKADDRYDDYYLYSVITSSAVYGLLRVWIIQDIDRTPKDIIQLMKHHFGDNIFHNISIA